MKSLDKLSDQERIEYCIHDVGASIQTNLQEIVNIYENQINELQVRLKNLEDEYNKLLERSNSTPMERWH